MRSMRELLQINEYANYVGGISTLSICTFVYSWEPLGEILRRIAETDCSHVEIWADKRHLDARIFSDIPALKNLLDRLHLKVHSLHAPHSDVDIASLNEEERKSSTKLIRESIEFCSKVGGEIVIVHPCSTVIFGDAQNCLTAKSRAENSPYALATFLETMGTKLAVENLPNWGMEFWNRGVRTE